MNKEAIWVYILEIQRYLRIAMLVLCIHLLEVISYNQQDLFFIDKLRHLSIFLLLYICLEIINRVFFFPLLETLPGLSPFSSSRTWSGFSPLRSSSQKIRT
jgi:hypothetical protein